MDNGDDFNPRLMAALQRKGREMFGKKVLFVSCAIACIVSGANAASAKGIEVRAMAGGGYTLVNFDAVMDDPSATLEDWDQFNYSFSLQALWKVRSNICIGGEAGWERLYYYYYSAPYGYYRSYHEANWTTVFVGGVAQYFLARSLYVLGGVDIHSFSGDGTALGISAGIGTEFKLSEKLAIPLEFRVKPVLGSGTPTVLQINLGAAFSSGR
jgi:hypothetical protein